MDHTFTVHHASRDLALADSTSWLNDLFQTHRVFAGFIETLLYCILSALNGCKGAYGLTLVFNLSHIVGCVCQLLDDFTMGFRGFGLLANHSAMAHGAEDGDTFYTADVVSRFREVVARRWTGKALRALDVLPHGESCSLSVGAFLY